MLDSQALGPQLPVDLLCSSGYTASLGLTILNQAWFGASGSLGDLIEDLRCRPESLYGEITPAGVRYLGECLWMQGGTWAGQEVAELGSGMGRCVLQIFLENANVERIIGIELDHTRHTAALQAIGTCLCPFRPDVDTSSLKYATALGVSSSWRRWRVQGRVLELLCGNILQSWHSWRSATAVFASSLCFPAAVMETMADQLEACHRLRKVMSLQMLPRYVSFTMVDVQHWPMSWQQERGCPVYIYERCPSYPLYRCLLEEPWASKQQSSNADKEISELGRVHDSRRRSILLWCLLPLLCQQNTP